MAERILRTTDGLEYKYEEYAWGDFVSGGKEVLQRMGIGVGIGFPGEPGCNKRQITTTDPRGFPCIIKRGYDWSKFAYEVSISHPGRERHDHDDKWQEVFPGVQFQSRDAADHFKGTADALTEAGIVPAGMFPGMPGMRSVRISILADGTLPTGHRNANNGCFGRHREGTKTIEKRGKYNYLVRVRVSREIADKRHSVSWAHHRAWEERMAAMPRAPRIDLAIRNGLNDLARQKRANLCLVWSRPKFVPGFNALPQGPFAR